jgi:hypothetical protein
METARELADRIASRAPVAVAKAKAAILATQQLPLDEGPAFKVDRTYEVMATPDRVEGMQALIEKHAPVFIFTASSISLWIPSMVINPTSSNFRPEIGELKL